MSAVGGKDPVKEGIMEQFANITKIPLRGIRKIMSFVGKTAIDFLARNE